MLALPALQLQQGYIARAEGDLGWAMSHRAIEGLRHTVTHTKCQVEETPDPRCVHKATRNTTGRPFAAPTMPDDQLSHKKVHSDPVMVCGFPS